MHLLMRSGRRGRRPSRISTLGCQATHVLIEPSGLLSSVCFFPVLGRVCGLKIRLTMYTDCLYYTNMRTFKWNAEKNAILEKERGITFEEIVEVIESGASVQEVDHPNPAKYPNQRVLIVDVDGYAHMVPSVKDGEDLLLKTIIPSRKATRKFIGGKHDKEK